MGAGDKWCCWGHGGRARARLAIGNFEVAKIGVLVLGGMTRETSAMKGP